MWQFVVPTHVVLVGIRQTTCPIHFWGKDRLDVPARIGFSSWHGVQPARIPAESQWSVASTIHLQLDTDTGNRQGENMTPSVFGTSVTSMLQVWRCPHQCQLGAWKVKVKRVTNEDSTTVGEAASWALQNWDENRKKHRVTSENFPLNLPWSVSPIALAINPICLCIIYVRAKTKTEAPYFCGWNPHLWNTSIRGLLAFSHLGAQGVRVDPKSWSFLTTVSDARRDHPHEYPWIVGW